MRKTKIVCTLGPATDNPEILRRMISAGMNVARLNFSHDIYENHKKRIDMVKAARKEMGVPVAILLDTKGPEIRIKTFKDGAVTLIDGQKFVLTTEEVEGTEEKVSVSYKKLPQSIRPGARLLINDGMIALKCSAVTRTDIICTVESGGILSNRKSINIPGVAIDMPFLSKADEEDILFGIKNDVDYVAASFVRSAEDVREIRNLMYRNGCEDVDIIAKIENRQGVDNIDSIIEASDGIMVARGDMGVEIPFTELPAIQKSIIKKCYLAGKKVITATQMLESMINNYRPTRAEISDVANAVYDGTSATMLSGETAVGKYPVESVQTMASISEQAEKDINYKKRFLSLNVEFARVTDAVCHACVAAAHDLDAAAIIAVTHSGTTARMLSRFRPHAPIIAATVSEKAYYKLGLNWGIFPVIAAVQVNTDELFDHSIDCAKRLGYIHDGDLVIITAGVPVGIPGNTNIMKITHVT